MKIHKYQLVEEFLLQYIELNNGGSEPLKLPSENSLMIRFGISRATARAAVERLVKKGVAYPVQGSGTYFNPPNAKHAASTLLSKKRVSVIVPYSTSNFLNNIIDGILSRLNKENCFTSVCYTHMDYKLEAHIINEISSSFVSGMIIYPTDTSNFNLVKQPFFSIPSIFIDRRPNLPDINFIASDHYSAMNHAAKLLFEKGYRNLSFMFIGNHYISSMKERIKGFNDAIAEAGYKFLPENFLHLQLGSGYPAYYDSIKQFLLKYPHIDGIIVQSGCLSFILNNVMNELGLKPVDDIGIICYDHEIEDFMDPFTEKCAYINQNPQQLGQEAAESLLKIIQKKPSETLEKRIKFSISRADVFDRK